MKILLVHTHDFQYEAKEKTAVAETIEEERRSRSFGECLVVFTAVEKGDQLDLESVIGQAVHEINEVYKKIDPKLVVIYPYAHLSFDLAAPSIAIEALKGIEDGVKELGYPVWRAPFGWYKSFKINCIGHPLSELSREIKPGGEHRVKTRTRESIVENIRKEHFVITPDGREIRVDLSKPDVSSRFTEFPLLKKFLDFEAGRTENLEPPSIKAMRRLEIADYEEASDPGNFRFYPKGALIFNLLKDWAEEIAIKRLNCFEIETPLLYDWSRPEIRGQGESFHERHYMVQVPKGNKELVLRFAGDFGLFSMVKDATLTYRQLPLRIYEYSKSFRYEKSGELTGLRRLRAFSMPDIHSFCEDMEQGWKEYADLFRNYTDLANGTGIDYSIAFRIVDKFYEQYKDRLFEMIRYAKRPAFVETLSEMKHYWAVKHEFQGFDAVDGCCQLSTVQLDVEDAARYGINYVDRNGEKKGCIICHSSIGSLERWIYVILENALRMEVPVWPLWLAPVQVRVVPISERHIEKAAEVGEKLSKMNIRVDVDDSSETLNKKIRDAEVEWIPYICVIGDREVEKNSLAVRIRGRRGQKEMMLEELGGIIKTETAGMPFRPLAGSLFLTKRPIFVG